MPSNIVISSLTPETVKTGITPFIATRSDLRDGSRPTTDGAIFSDSFNYADWTSGLPENDLGNPTGFPDTEQRVTAGNTLPGNWDSCRQAPSFADSVGFTGGAEAVEILSANSAMARSNGKCFVGLRESVPEPNWFWGSESALWKNLGQDYTSLYVEFWIKFSDNWTTTPSDPNNDWSSKIFRIGSWSGSGSEFQNFEGGENGPILFWNYQNNKFGVRNLVQLRGGPHGDNYRLDFATDWPDKPVRNGTSFNWTTDQQGQAPGGTDPQIVDLVNGGFLLDNPGQTVTHEQVFGTQYNKMAFYVEMNSDPALTDGKLKQWFNGQRILNSTQIRWCKDSLVGWNFFEIGGNDFFKEYPQDQQRQERYAIDDIVVRETIPAGLE